MRRPCVASPRDHFLRKRSSRTTSAPDLSPALVGVARRPPASAAAGCGAARLAGRWSAAVPAAGVARLRRLRRGFGLAAGWLASPSSVACVDGLELQPELHRRIDEALDRVERHQQPLRHAAERQADLERLVADLQIPELVLQDDGHLLRILLAQPRRQPHALGRGVEGDVEMMLARQALLGGVGQHVRTTPRSASWARMS